MPRSTNTEFVHDLMEFSPYGALAQVFILQALEQFSAAVVAAGPAACDTALVDGKAWVGVAEDIAAKLKERHDG